MIMRILRQIPVILLTGSLVCVGDHSASAQVTVGYSSITSAVGAAIVGQTYRQRTTDQYEITGVNVEPNDGGNVFNRRTIWKIYDQSKPWSLSIVDNDPKVDVNKEATSTKLVQAGRRESVYSVISGPLYSTIQRQTLSPFASVQLPPIIPTSTTVFPDSPDPASTSPSP
jgi:hypothetical protein